jgi:hypothetical protein
MTVGWARLASDAGPLLALSGRAQGILRFRLLRIERTQGWTLPLSSALLLLVPTVKLFTAGDRPAVKMHNSDVLGGTEGEPSGSTWPQ